MFHRKITKAVILFIALSGVFSSFTMSDAQSEFPRISYIDAYWVHRNEDLGNGQTHFGAYDYFWPQMDSCGFTHVVTDGDTTSLLVPDTLRLLNAYLDPTSNVWRYSTGVVNDYPVGGSVPYESYFYLKETGANIVDGDRLVFAMLCDSHDAGVVFDSSFGAWEQLMRRDYYFTFTMKMVGDTSDSVEVARVHIWETDAASYDDQSEHRWLTWKDLGGGERGNADDTLIIYSSDFSASGVYEEIELEPIHLWAEQKDTHITFEWLDTKDLYIDHLRVRDQWNYDLFVSEDSSDKFEYIQDMLQSRYDINPVRNYRFYVDEPAANQYPSYGKVNDLAKEKPGVPLNGATGGRTKYDLEIFVARVDPDELLYNRYTIESDIDTCSSGPNSLQNAWYRLISEPKGTGWTHFGMRAAATVADSAEIPFWMTIQACKESYFSAGEWHRLRAPTRNELFAEAHLALCYGAKGIMYYEYPSFINEHNGYTDTLCGLVDLVNGDDEPTWDLTAEDSHYIPNYRWYAAQEINAKIDSLDDVLLSLNWKAAFVSHPDSINTYATFVESLYGEQFGTDTSYVEIGIFQHDDGTDYLMLVNRRCLSTEKDTVTVCIDTTTHNFRVLYDVYKQKSYYRTDGAFSNIPLEPGEGKLFELSNTLRVSGTIDENTTWGDGFKYFVEGDVTVETDVTLTIEPGTIVEFATTDNQNSGDDSTKCELIVYGTLDAYGTYNYSIVFTSNATSPSKSDWYGIEFMDPASNSSRIGYCQIKYAHKGICCHKCSLDVCNTAISNCAYGAYVDASGTKLSLDHVTCDSCSYGVRVQQGAAKLWVSQFRNNGFGISCNSSSRYFFPPDICPDFVLCEVSYNSFSGVILDDSSPIINGCDISHNGAWGLKCLDDSDPILGENDLKSNRESSKLCKNNGSLKSGPPQMDGGGLFCSGTSCPIVCDGPVMGSYKRGWNVITDNDGDGVYCTGQSAPKLGRGWHIHEGQNSLGDNARYDVYNSTGSMVWAEYNWWGDANGPDTAKIYGSVDWDPYLDEEPSKGKASGGSGHLALLGLLTRPKTRETLGTKTKGQDPDSTGTAEEYNELGTYYLLQMMYDEAIEAFQYVLTNFSDCVDANYALVHLMHCYREGGYQADIFPYLQNLSSSSLNPELKNLALYMSVSQLCGDGQYGQALNRCQALLAAGCDEEMEKSLRLREGMLYRYGLDDDEAAIAVFQDFITRYSEDPLTSIAQVELEILGVSQPPKATPGAPTTKPTVPLPESFVLYQNYPNPFNARTCIEYELPRDIRVTLKIYNVLGQQVKTLANDFHHAGHYKLFWDGRNSMGSEIASGIYFIRLEAGTYALTRKTVLLR